MNSVYKNLVRLVREKNVSAVRHKYFVGDNLAVRAYEACLFSLQDAVG
jgi:hypothetical protein